MISSRLERYSKYQTVCTMILDEPNPEEKVPGMARDGGAATIVRSLIGSSEAMQGLTQALISGILVGQQSSE